MKTTFSICFWIFTKPVFFFSIRFNGYSKIGESTLDKPLSCQTGSKCYLCWEHTDIGCQVPCYNGLNQTLTVSGSLRVYNPLLFSTSSNIVKGNRLVGCGNETSPTVTDGHWGVPLKLEANLDKKTFKNILNHQETNFVSPENIFKLSSGDLLHSQTKESPRNERIKGRSVHRKVLKYPQELKLRLQNCYSFLLLNSTIEEHSLKTNLSEIYETLRNSDMSKVLVKVLQNKLKWLTEKEKLGLQGTQTTTIPRSSTDSNKFDIENQVFMKSEESKITKPNHMSTSENIKQDKSFELRKSVENIDPAQEFNKMMDQFYVENTGHFGQAEHQTDFTDGTNYDTIEYFNMKLPYDIEHVDNTETNLLESNSTTDKYNQKSNLDSVFKGENNKPTNTTSKINNHNTMLVPSKGKSQTNVTTCPTCKTVLWPVKKNISAPWSDKFRHLFVWHKILNSSSKDQVPIRLNEHFLLTLNSKNMSRKESAKLFESSEVDKATTPYDNYDSLSYQSSVDSASSDTEELYNNSIVFVVHERNTTGLKKNARWKSILNFLHISRAISHPEYKYPQIDFSDGSSKNKVSVENTQSNLQKSTEVTKDASTTTPAVILLPESLMPEALEKRLLNNTNLIIYEDSYEDENQTLKNSTRSPFLFFFK